MFSISSSKFFWVLGLLCLLFIVSAGIAVQLVFDAKDNEEARQSVNFSRELWLGQIGLFPLLAVIALALVLGRSLQVLQAQLWSSRLEAKEISKNTIDRIARIASEITGKLDKAVGTVNDAFKG